MKSYSSDDLGKSFLVEECQRIEINPLLRSAKEKLKATLLASEIEAVGVPLHIALSQSTFGTRYWFMCPMCQRRVGVLFIQPITSAIGCRTCLGLEYRKRRFKGMVEAGV